MIVKNCFICSVSFSSSGNRAKFCEICKTKFCLTCKKEFKTSPSRIKDGKGKFCSKKCFVFYQGEHNYIKDITNQRFGRLVAISFQHRDKNGYLWLFKCDCGKEKLIRNTPVISGVVKSCGCLAIEKSIERNKLHSGKNSSTWIGDKIKYGGLHSWVHRHLGRPTTCEHCEKTNLTKYQIDWANKSHKYLRDLTD